VHAKDPHPCAVKASKNAFPLHYKIFFQSFGRAEDFETGNPLIVTFYKVLILSEILDKRKQKKNLHENLFSDVLNFITRCLSWQFCLLFFFFDQCLRNLVGGRVKICDGNKRNEIL
jgi:hypothetical protein